MSNITGQPLDRVDGRLKVTGGARYAAEIPMTGVVHGVLLKSAIASGRIRNIDTSAAQKAPGVIAVITHLNAPRLGRPTRMPSGDSFPILQGPEIWYGGQSIGIVVADTLPRAEHAAKLVRVEYDSQPPAASVEEKLDSAFTPGQGLTGGRPPKTTRGDLAQGLAAAAKKVEATYTTPIHHHNAMEPHATLALWEGENLTTYNATQNVNGNKQALADALGIPMDKVRVINHFVGGGFGSKGMSWPHTVIAAVAAQMVKRPVKLSLTREQMYTSNGHRPYTVQKLSLGATPDGKLTAVGHDTISHTSMMDDFVEPSGVLTQMLYSCPNVEVSHRLIRLNVGTPTFTRAPGEASGSFALESALDELAYELQLDPIELRLRNYAERDEGENKPFSSKSLRECYQRGAEAFGWSRRNPTPGSMRDGRYLIGMGMATATYPANFRPSTARALLYADGSLQIQTASHDLGTGTYTILTQVAADALGIPVEKVRVEIGDTKLPEATGAGGSTSAASVGSAVQAACNALKQRLVQISTSDKDSPLSGKTPQQVVAENGRIHLKDDASVGETYTQLMNRRGEKLLEAQATGQRSSGGGAGGGQGGGQNSGGEHQDKGSGGGYSFHGFGAQFMEVRVDPELGEVRVTRAVGAFANGRILNRKTALSQFQGGMVWGIGMGLLESTYLDSQFGRFVNSNLADYLVPVNADVPEIEVIIVDEEDPYVNPIGVKGIGEIGIVGAAAAIANAVYHATGKRVRDLPITLDKLI